MNENMNEFDLRGTLGAFVTGVTVVCAVDERKQPRGLTANSFTSVSLQPPLILVCINRLAASFEVFQQAARFSVNFLTEKQKDISAVFASKRADKFQTVNWDMETDGPPIIDGVLGWLDCSTEQRVEAGDHMILIGRVRRFGRNTGRPLGYFSGGYVTFFHEQDVLATVVSHGVGCLVETDNHVLLCRRRGEDKWSVPTSLPAPDSKESSYETLHTSCHRLGWEIDLTFIYSIFTAKDGYPVIVYRGTAVPVAGVKNKPNETEVAFFALESLPWNDLADHKVKAMLTRYVKERTESRFGIYVEFTNGGAVAPIGELEPFAQYLAGSGNALHS